VFTSVSVSHHLMHFSSGCVILALSFTARYLNVYQYLPKLKPIYRALKISALLHFISFPFVKFYIGGLTGHTIDITILLSLLIMLGSGIYILIKYRFVTAIFYVLSWGALLTSAIMWFMMVYGLIPQNEVTKYFILWGSIAEMLVLSLGLAYRIVQLDRAKQTAEIKGKERDRYQLLLRVVLHDIANPLSVIKTYLSMLKGELSKKGKVENLQGKLDKSSKATEVINEIIKSIRNQELSYNQEELKLTKVSLEEVIESSCFILNDSCAKKDIRITLPEHYYHVHADKVLLMNNVLTNFTF
jgi:signal transduction histidine kinase